MKLRFIPPDPFGPAWVFFEGRGIFLRHARALETVRWFLSGER